MEIVLLCTLLAGFLATCLGAALLCGFAAGYAYHPYYNDGAERSGARAWPFFRGLVSHGLALVARHYFSYRVVYMPADGTPSALLEEVVKQHVLAEGDEQPKAAIFAAHPHGLFAVSSLALLVSAQPWRSLTPCIHRHVFAVPVLRELALWLGAIDVSAENIRARLDRGRSVFMVPGGCREMIQVAASGGRAGGGAGRDANDITPKPPRGGGGAQLAILHPDLLLSPLFLFGALSTLPFLLYQAEYGSYVTMLITVVVVLCALELLVRVASALEVRQSRYDVQERHHGFLKLAWAKQVPVFPVLHHGQERVFRSYSCRQLDALRGWMLDATGYPFPSLFLGPLPARLTTYIYEPHRPDRYASEEAFIAAYYAALRISYEALCGSGPGCGGGEPSIL